MHSAVQSRIKRDWTQANKPSAFWLHSYLSANVPRSRFGCYLSIINIRVFRCTFTTFEQEKCSRIFTFTQNYPIRYNPGGVNILEWIRLTYTRSNATMILISLYILTLQSHIYVYIDNFFVNTRYLWKRKK